MTLFDTDHRGRQPRPLGSAPSAEERTVQGQMMTPKEKVKVHVQIERENRRKLKEWKKGGKAA